MKRYFLPQSARSLALCFIGAFLLISLNYSITYLYQARQNASSPPLNPAAPSLVFSFSTPFIQKSVIHILNQHHIKGCRIHLAYRAPFIQGVIHCKGNLNAHKRSLLKSFDQAFGWHLFQTKMKVRAIATQKRAPLLFYAPPQISHPLMAISKADSFLPSLQYVPTRPQRTAGFETLIHLKWQERLDTPKKL